MTATPTFSWSAVAGATFYDVWVNDATKNQSQVLRNAQITTTSWIPPTPLTPGDSYLWWVRAFVPGGNTSSWTGGTSFTVAPLAAVAPVTPTGTIFSAQPSFTWNPVAGADFYDVWVDDVSSGKSQALRNASAAGTSWTPLVALTPGDKYQWWVRALSNNGNAGPWNAATQFTFALLGSTTLIGPSTPNIGVLPTFTWNAVAGASYYDLWVDDQTTGKSQILRNTHVAANSFTAVSSLPAGRTYRWWVQAYNNTGDYSLWSNSLTFSV